MHGWSAGSCQPLGESRSWRRGAGAPGSSCEPQMCVRTSTLCADRFRNAKPFRVLVLGRLHGLHACCAYVWEFGHGKTHPPLFAKGIAGSTWGLGWWYPKTGLLEQFGSVWARERSGCTAPGLRGWSVWRRGAGCFALHLNSAQHSLG